MKKLFFLASMLVSAMFVSAQQVANYDVVPLPNQISYVAKTTFVLTSNSRIAYAEGNEEMERNAHFLQEYIKTNTGIKALLSTNTAKPAQGTILLLLDPKIEGDEAYQISVNQKNIVVKGKTPVGVFYGVQTLRKSLPTEATAQVEFPAVEIKDSPRFSYRGMMLDVGRHYFPVEFIKEYIDLIAMHNMNTFHWHLTEDQGWRIEIKKYPLLTAKGSIRKKTTLGKNSQIYDNEPYGGFYTQDEAREIVEYARQRHITVIPEIDMPGHMKAVLACYPELSCDGKECEVGENWGVYHHILCMGNEKSYEFCEDVLTEIMDIFPSKLIHIGGDEAPKKFTKDCPKCQKLMADNGLTLKNVQGYFTNRIEKFVNSKGRSIMGWDEILEEGDINQSAMIHCWRGLEHGIKAAQAGHNVVMSPTAYCYFDYYQADPTKSSEPLAIGGYLPVEKVYEMNAVPEEVSPENRKYIIGVQANLWTEYVAHPSHAAYMVLPRMAALSEEQWCQKKGTFEAFKPRLTRLTGLYRLYNMTYAKHLWPETIWGPDRDF